MCGQQSGRKECRVSNDGVGKFVACVWRLVRFRFLSEFSCAVFMFCGDVRPAVRCMSVSLDSEHLRGGVKGAEEGGGRGELRRWGGERRAFLLVSVKFSEI